MPLLTADEIAANVEKLRNHQDKQQAQLHEAVAQATRRFAYVRPLGDAAETVIDAIENAQDRFMLGLDPIDFRTRGFGPKELVLVTGFAHAGKTQLINTAILNNRHKHVLFFSMDDPAEMILLKLVCMLENVDAETLEKRIRQGDQPSKLAMRQAATQVFDKLTIVDESIGLEGMNVALSEYEQLHGRQPDCVVIDYVGSMQGEGADDGDGGIKRKMQALKRWVKDKPFCTIALHQNTRSNGGPGAPITLLSGGYGGEQEATMVLGVRRKRDWDELEQGIRDLNRDTVTLHLVKNKRPPGKKTPADGVDFHMVADTGLIRLMGEADVPARSSGITSAADAVRARGNG